MSSTEVLTLILTIITVQAVCLIVISVVAGMGRSRDQKHNQQLQDRFLEMLSALELKYLHAVNEQAAFQYQAQKEREQLVAQNLIDAQVRADAESRGSTYLDDQQLHEPGIQVPKL